MKNIKLKVIPTVLFVLAILILYVYIRDTMIENEINERIDNHSQQVLVANIELILSYSQRFYNRQFNTRAAQNSDIVSKVESLLKDYFKKNDLMKRPHERLVKCAVISNNTPLD